MTSSCGENQVQKEVSKDSNVNLNNSQLIKILVLPSDSKKFRIDEETNTLLIEPLENATNLQETNENPLKSNTYESIECVVYEKTPPDKSCKEMGNDTPSFDSKPECLVPDIKATSIEIKKIMEFGKNTFKIKSCFLKGCKWSPDGFCLLTNSEDNVLRLFEIPEHTTGVNTEDILPVLTAKEGGTIYDFEWYPKMDSNDPVTCVFASTSQASPIHLWDAYTGSLRATYQPINQYDEVTAAYSIAFSPDGQKLYSGFKKCLRIFDVSIPGRVSEERNLKCKGNPFFQTNIVSTIAINPMMQDIYALGSYDKSIGIYTEPDGKLLCLLNGHRGGITQVMFSADGMHLYSGGRKDFEIICWDLRNPGKILFILNRIVTTNQRIFFDVLKAGSYLVTGSTDNRIIIYDTKSCQNNNVSPPDSAVEWIGHEDCVNGVQFHPHRSILASSSGQHHIQTHGLTDDIMEEPDWSNNSNCIENLVKIWSFDIK